jgi:hypothetical protein
VNVRGFVVAAVLAMLAMAPVAIAPVVWPHSAPPAGLSRPIGEFARTLSASLDRPIGTHARFVGAEQRSNDRLTVLLFELRSWPYAGSPQLAYLVSRCVETASLEPQGMGGGIIPGGDPGTDEELEHVRSGSQPPCGSSVSS